MISPASGFFSFLNPLFKCFRKSVDTSSKPVRLNVIDLKNNHPEAFGRFVMALKHLEESDDWYRICGIHGNTFKPNDAEVKCPTDPNVVAVISQTGEPVYCKHSVYPFIAWHAPYVYQFELLLNKYSTSQNKDYIALPYMDLTDFTVDFTFMNDPTITIMYDGDKITIDNPLASANYYVDGVKTKITRDGFLTPITKNEKTKLNTVKKQLNNALYASTYEKFSSQGVVVNKADVVVDYIPLETPHNSLHDIIGGPSGNMADISISAFDPLFWLHHCNMDRHYYTWMSLNTNAFSQPLTLGDGKISELSYKATGAPFYNSGIFSTNFKNYKWGWQNSGDKFMTMSQVLDLSAFPYTYDIIVPQPAVKVWAFVELIDIPIPIESTVINAFIHLKTDTLNRDVHYAGTAFWFGLNRANRSCSRCAVARTNLKIDIEAYAAANSITNANVGDYAVIIEGEGRLIVGARGYNIYSQEELIKDGSLELIVK